jgi:hypothetical protein
VSSGAIEINHRSTCSKTDAVDYIEKPKGTIQISKFDKDREKIKELLKLVEDTNHIALNTNINKGKVQYF